MSQTVPVSPTASLHECIALANEVKSHPQANEAFAELRKSLKQENPLAAELLLVLWQEMLSARRSAAFWEQISNVERDLTEEMAANHLQLQQNYLRLVQEQ